MFDQSRSGIAIALQPGTGGMIDPLIPPDLPPLKKLKEF